MNTITYRLAAIALVALAVSPSAAAQKRAVVDADVPGAMVPEKRSTVQAPTASDQDVPGARKPYQQPDQRTRGIFLSDQDKDRLATSPLADLSQNRLIVRLGVGRDLSAPAASAAKRANPFPNGRDLSASATKRAPDSGPRAMTVSGRALNARPGTPTPLAPEAASDPEAPLAKADPADTAPDRDVTLGASMPNPVSETAQIAFTLAQEASVSLALYDVRGREVASLYEGVAAAGDHRVTLDASRLAPGTYVYVLEADGERMSRQLQVVR